MPRIRNLPIDRKRRMNKIIESDDLAYRPQASQYARSLIEASLDPLVTISPEGKITDVNEATDQGHRASRATR